MDEVGYRIRQLIESQYISVNDFCRKNGFKQSYISAILTGSKDMGINTARRLLEIFPDVTLDYLFFGSYNKNVIGEVQEPQSQYGQDVFEKLLLGYLERPNVKKKVAEIIKNEDEIELNITLGEENSELFSRLEEILKKDFGTQARPTLKIITHENKGSKK
jgi:transcriptional regulator with XRE-family HTH domain